MSEFSSLNLLNRRASMFYANVRGEQLSCGAKGSSFVRQRTVCEVLVRPCAWLPLRLIPVNPADAKDDQANSTPHFTVVDLLGCVKRSGPRCCKLPPAFSCSPGSPNCHNISQFNDVNPCENPASVLPGNLPKGRQYLGAR